MTMGTGTFFDCNTGSEPHASVAGIIKWLQIRLCPAVYCQNPSLRFWFISPGLYPLIGWKIGKECVYVAEGSSSDTGVCLEWAKKMGQC